MYNVETRVPTVHASRYLQQLCKHWTHRLSVVFTPLAGRVQFNEQAQCVLTADASGLDVLISAPDAAEASKLGRVVIEHLQRFAFREPFAAPVWRLADAA